MKRHVVIVGTIYPLLLYLLHKANNNKNTHTVYFVSKQLAQFADRLPNAIVINEFHPYKNFILRKFSELLWIIVLRLKRATIWRKHFRNAEIFAQDHFVFSSMLISNSDYVYISDGFNDFNAYMRTEIYHNTSQWRNNLSIKHRLIKLLCGSTWKGWFCLNEQCSGMLHESPHTIPYAKRPITPYKVDMIKIWNNINAEQKAEICHVFDISMSEVEEINKYSVLLLAQNFECTDDISDEELVDIYRKAIANFDESQVIIKTHQFGRIQYKKYFSQAFVFDKPIPMQLLALLGADKIKTAITINSTAVSLFGNNVDIIWLSEEVHPKLFARYGKNTMDEIVSTQK